MKHVQRRAVARAANCCPAVAAVPAARVRGVGLGRPDISGRTCAQGSGQASWPAAGAPCPSRCRQSGCSRAAKPAWHGHGGGGIAPRLPMLNPERSCRLRGLHRFSQLMTGMRKCSSMCQPAGPMQLPLHRSLPVGQARVQDPDGGSGDDLWRSSPKFAAIVHRVSCGLERGGPPFGCLWRRRICKIVAASGRG